MNIILSVYGYGALGIFTLALLTTEREKPILYGEAFIMGLAWPLFFMLIFHRGFYNNLKKISKG